MKYNKKVFLFNTVTHIYCMYKKISLYGGKLSISKNMKFLMNMNVNNTFNP